MGYDLRRSAHGISVGVRTWACVCALAIEGGWEPEGTLPPPGESGRVRKWSGAYHGTEGQTITAEDASAMAGALTQMLGRINGEPKFLQFGDAMPSEAVSFFGGESKRRMLALMIEFLRGGSCRIW